MTENTMNDVRQLLDAVGEVSGFKNTTFGLENYLSEMADYGCELSFLHRSDADLLCWALEYAAIGIPEKANDLRRLQRLLVGNIISLLDMATIFCEIRQVVEALGRIREDEKKCPCTNCPTPPVT